MNNYFGEFEGKKISDEFDVGEDQEKYIDSLDIICAAYNCETYEGDAFVLFRKDGKLYEVNDSHCSCYGLQDFEPEETTKEALLLKGEDYGVWSAYGDELKKIIEAL